jgi:hypothetical protein
MLYFCKVACTHHTPRNPKTGYFCFVDIRRDEHQVPYVSLACTTKKLQFRSTEDPKGTSTADGGFRFTVLGWPLIPKCEVNGRGQHAPTALILVSSMKVPQVDHALCSLASAAEKVSGRSASKAYTMSDAEKAFRQGLSSAHGSQVLMCWFHVTSAIRAWLMSNVVLPFKLREAFWLTKVKPDIDCLHRSLSAGEFQVKSAAIMQEWQTNGVNAITCHLDAKGRPITFGVYFEHQWIQQVSEWSAAMSPGAPVLSTNNATEKRVGLTRKHAGTAPCGAIALAKFMMSEVECWSSDPWDAAASRPIKIELWKRAYEFKKLFDTMSVRKVSLHRETFFACFGRTGDDIKSRPRISATDALRLVQIRSKLHAGEDVTYADVLFHRSGRVFGIINGVPHCTCPDFPDYRRCLHTLGHSLITGSTLPGQMKPPHCLDDMALMKGKRGSGRPQLVGGRYYKPPAPDCAEASSEDEDPNRVSKEDVRQIHKLLCEAIRKQPMSATQGAKTRPDATAADSSSHTEGVKKRPAHAMSNAKVGKVNKRPASSGAQYIKITVTTSQNGGFPSEFELQPGATVSEAVERIADLVGSNVSNIQVSDRNVRLPGPTKGFTMGAPWLSDDATQIFEDHDVLVLPHLRGG